MFSGLSKLADRSFVLGFFFPALLGVIALTYGNRDKQPFKHWLVIAADGQQKFSEILLLLLAVWTIAVLLMVLNLGVYRFLEGYFWPLNGPFARKNQQRKATRIMDRWCKAYELYANARKSAEEIKGKHGENSSDFANASRTVADLRKKSKEAEERYRLAYPLNSKLIMGTRLGNVTRSFEIYPSEAYGLDGIYAWHRLLTVIPKEYQTVLSDARSAVDLFMSLVVVSIAISLTTIVRGFLQLAEAPKDWTLAVPFFLNAVIAAVIGWLCYDMSVWSSMTWGEKFKSAFDVYLADLARKFGYVVPVDAQSEREFWGKWGDQFRFHWPKNMDSFQRADDKGK